MNSSLGNIKAVAKRELIGYFSSPVAYVFLVIFLLLSGFFTFMVGRAPFFDFGQASLVTFFIWQPWLFLFLVPAVGMRKRNSHRSEEHTSELQSRGHLVCRLLLEKKKMANIRPTKATGGSLPTKNAKMTESR